MVLLIGVDTVRDLGEFLGALAMLGAALSYGLGAMYAKRRFTGAGVPPLVVSFFACAAAAVHDAPARARDAGGISPDLGEIAAVVEPRRDRHRDRVRPLLHADRRDRRGPRARCAGT